MLHYAHGCRLGCSIVGKVCQFNHNEVLEMATLAEHSLSSDLVRFLMPNNVVWRHIAEHPLHRLLTFVEHTCAMVNNDEEGYE